MSQATLPSGWNPLVYEPAKEFIDGHFILSDLSARITRPSSTAMDLHSDQWWLPRMSMPGKDHWPVASLTRKDIDEGGVEPATHPINPLVVMKVIFAHDANSMDMGPTRFVLGSHLTGRIPDSDGVYDEDVSEVTRDRAVIFDGCLWHGATPNVSNKPRYTALCRLSPQRSNRAFSNLR